MVGQAPAEPTVGLRLDVGSARQLGVGSSSSLVVGHTGVLKPTQVVGDKQHILSSSEYSPVRSFDTWERVQKKWIREFGPEGIAAQLVSPTAKDEKDGPEGIANQPASPIAKDEKDNVDHTLPPILLYEGGVRSPWALRSRRGRRC